MALIFYYGSGSPYAWRVWLALEHKRVAYDHKTLSFSAGDLRKPEYLAINPRHRVPAVVDDGFALYESVAIVEYLDEKYPGPKLFPGDARQRALVRRMVQEADQYYAVAMEKLVDQVLFTPQDKWDPDKIDEGRQGLTRELAQWESLIRGHYLAGELSAADFTLYPLIALTLRMEKKKPDLALSGAIGPTVAAWIKRIEALPYFQKTWPPHWK
ncbi:MAG TPA: glutathione S-transferase family protein [Burkholderiales bacterium]|nr:glutathione S-transferase family protein [Burkholderiales bacterium]